MQTTGALYVTCPCIESIIVTASETILCTVSVMGAKYWNETALPVDLDLISLIFHEVGTYSAVPPKWT